MTVEWPKQSSDAVAKCRKFVGKKHTFFSEQPVYYIHDLVKEVRKEDEGRYECQISTQNKMSHFAYLKVERNTRCAILSISKIEYTKQDGPFSLSQLEYTKQDEPFCIS